VKPGKSKEKGAVLENLRTCFKDRLAFQLGINARTQQPVIYHPVGEMDWIDTEGRQLS